nr:MAG TPA: hypothetical protein [Caudoviricetes sp.]
MLSKSCCTSYKTRLFVNKKLFFFGWKSLIN